MATIQGIRVTDKVSVTDDKALDELTLRCLKIALKRKTAVGRALMSAVRQHYVRFRQPEEALVLLYDGLEDSNTISDRDFLPAFLDAAEAAGFKLAATLRT